MASIDSIGRGETDAIVAAVRHGDPQEFADLAERHRRELQVHCYRLLGNLDDAEDLVQDTLVRAWKSRTRFEGRATFRAWLYRIATNACLDTIRQRRRRAPTIGQLDGRPSYDQLPWLQPLPDLALVTSTEADPESAIVQNETIELSVLAAIQHLLPRQRAALVLRDLLVWTPGEIAEALDDSTAAVNSLLQRARRRLRELGQDGRLTHSVTAPPTDEELALLQRYMDAHARADASAVIAILADDVQFSMPPALARYDGRTAVAAFFERIFGVDSPGAWHLIPVRANGQLAAANYVRGSGDFAFHPMTLDLLRFRNGSIAEITTFETDAFRPFELPRSLPARNYLSRTDGTPPAAP